MSLLESNSLLPPSQFPCRRGKETCYALITFSHFLGLLDSVVRSEESLCESEPCLIHRKERQCLVFALRFVTERANHPF